MLPSSVIEKLKATSGLSLENPKDYEFLSLETHLGVNTLKRLCGYVQEYIEPRPSTLDIVAQYLGHKTWTELLHIVPSDSEWSNEGLYADEIRIGESVIVEWLPNRLMELKCIGNETFRVAKVYNGKLCIGDEIHIELFRLHHPLVVTNIVRQGNILTNNDGTKLNYIAGKQNGIYKISIINNND